MNQSFMQAMQYRHACKQFDPEKKISSEDFEQILQFGRLSPSSFGMEHWKFIVIETPELRRQLRQACWDQPQITDSSHVIVIVAKIAAVLPDSDYIKAMFARKGLQQEALEAYLQRYRLYHHSEINPYISTYAWSARQCYLALANMLTGAASMGIDSCPIEGFSKKAVDTLLELDTSQYQSAVIATFGYRAGEQTPCYRLDTSDIVEFR